MGVRQNVRHVRERFGHARTGDQRPISSGCHGCSCLGMYTVHEHGLALRAQVADQGGGVRQDKRKRVVRVVLVDEPDLDVVARVSGDRGLFSSEPAQADDRVRDTGPESPDGTEQDAWIVRVRHCGGVGSGGGRDLWCGGPTGVSFGGTAATSFTVNSDTSITAVAPAEAAGPVDVTVTTSAGTSAAVSGDSFTFVTPAPVVTLVSPSSGSTHGRVCWATTSALRHQRTHSP